MENGEKSSGRDMERRVFIKQSGNPLTRFTSVSIMESDAVADLIKRASLTVGLRMNPAYVDLFLIPEESQDAVESGEGGFEATVLAMRPLSHIKALSTVGVFHGSCLLARQNGPPEEAQSPSEKDLVGALQRIRLAPASLTRTREASGFALDDQGFDEPVGWALAAASFLPLGRICDEIDAATAEAESVGAARTDFDAFSSRLQLENSLVIARSLTKVGEPVVQQVWDEDVRRWWPDITEGDGSFSSLSMRPEKLSTALVISKSCRVDFSRVVSLQSGQTSFVVAVGDLKSTLFNPLDGVPQALIAAFNAAADLHAKGLPISQCVVPFMSNTGALEQHGVAYLLEPSLPCAVLTTPVLDLADADGRKRIAIARWAFRKIAEETTRLMRALKIKSPGELMPPIAPALNLSQYHVKPPLPFVGRSVEHSVLHQLRIFERLRRSSAAAHVVLPAAVLMQRPVEKAASWAPTLAIAFPHLSNYRTGVPLPGEEYRAAVIQGLRSALRSVHRAGVVHLDLFSGNILWRPTAAEVNNSLEDSNRGGSVQVRLIDFDASLECGQLVPKAARQIVERNGHLFSYNPDLFIEGQTAHPAFDWWHFVLLSDEKSPFGKGGPQAADALAAWLQVSENLNRVRELVAIELAEAALEAGAASEASTSH